MATKHRKLFPEEPTTTTNETDDYCYGLCHPACPYNCYPNPDYSFFPPPPPPSSISEHSNQVNHISSYLIILVTLFAAIFVVVGCYVIKVKCYAAWCGWRVNGSVPSQSDEEFLNENQVDHPVWLIATVGLQQSIINSITVCKYNKNEGLVEGTECSVCLNEFQQGDTLRLLPKCNHAFHVPCIDTWLRSHTNCPLCRASIVSNNSVTPEAVVMEQENANLARVQEPLLEYSRNESGLSLGSNNVIQNRTTGAGESSEALELNIEESNSKERGNGDEIPDFENQTEMGSVSAHPMLLIVNSCSMESQSHSVVDDDKHEETMLDTRKQEQYGDYCYSKTCKTMRRSSIEECLHMSPVSMKRSFSRYVHLNSKLNSSLLEFSVH